MILLGNIVAFSGCIIMVLIGFVKEKKKILLLQCVQSAFMGTGNLLLGGIVPQLDGLLGDALRVELQEERQREVFLGE